MTWQEQADTDFGRRRAVVAQLLQIVPHYDRRDDAYVLATSTARNRAMRLSELSAAWDDLHSVPSGLPSSIVIREAGCEDHVVADE